MGPMLRHAIVLVFALTTGCGKARTEKDAGAAPLASVTAKAAVVVATTGPGAEHLVVDGTYVYWVVGRALEAKVQRAPKEGGAGELLARVTQSVGAMTGDEHHLFVNTSEGVVFKIAKTGGSRERLAEVSGERSLDVGIAADDTAVYFTALSSVRRVEKRGGEVTVLASGQAHPGGVAVDSHYTFWTNQISGEVCRVAKDGGAILVLARGQAFATEPKILVNDGRVVWVTAYPLAIWSVSVDGGTTLRLADAEGHARGLSVEGDGVLWGRSANVVNGRKVAAGGLMRVSTGLQGETRTLKNLAREAGKVTSIAADAEGIYFIDDERGAIFRVARVP